MTLDSSPHSHHAELSAFEEKLFERQLALPQFGKDGQLKLKAASVFISRVGGLGGTVAMLLARAGVGRLVLAHGGVVEPENLNRMPLAFRRHLDAPRMPAFVETLAQINPEVQVVPFAEHVSAQNIAPMVAQADLIVDASPDFAERYVMNAEAVRTGKPMVMAAMNGLECYATVIRPASTPCLACIYPQAPEGWEVLGFPVIAPTSSFVASLAAMEVIKLLCSIGRPLENILFYGDMSTNTYSRFNVRRRPDCAVCGAAPSV